jgi:hypothetical protein
VRAINGRKMFGCLILSRGSFAQLAASRGADVRPDFDWHLKKADHPNRRPGGGCVVSAAAICSNTSTAVLMSLVTVRTSTAWLIT